MKYTGLNSLHLSAKIKVELAIEEIITNAIETWPDMTSDDETVIARQIIQSLREGIDQLEGSVLDYLRSARSH